MAFEMKEMKMKSFDGLGLHRTLSASLEHMKYTTPTPIQAQAIPLALQGRDIMGSAQTGTGKTAAFAIPLIEALLRDERKHALVMTPTRELGKQVMEIMRQLVGPKGKVKTAFLIGGEAIGKQYAQLQRRPRLVVGTPGRINDHLERGNLQLDQTSFLVLDETDRMLDMGFSVQIDRVIKHMPKQRQTLMFSATMPKNIMQMADKYLDNPERIAVGSTTNPSKNIDQKNIKTAQDKKYSVLCSELKEREGSIIVFVKTKRGADRLARKLNDAEFSADTIHGDLQQRKRERVIQAYRGEKFRILVATDVVARGLDVPHVEHVINYDLPQMPEDYIHRIGRTARAGAKGNALNLIAPQDNSKWSAIERLMDPNAKPSNDSYGFKKGGGKKKSGYGGKGRSFDKSKSSYKGKRKFNDDRSGGGSNSNERRDDRPSFDKRSGEGKPFKKRKFAGDRNESRGDSRGEYRSEGRGEQRSNNRSDNRSDNRSEKRNSYRGDDRGANRSEGRNSEGRRSDSRGEGRSYEGKPAHKASNKKRSFKSNRPEQHGDAPFKGRRDRNDRSDRNEGGFAEGKRNGGKPAHKKVTKRSAEFSDNRNSEKRGGKPAGKSFGKSGKPSFKGNDGSQPRKFKRKEVKTFADKKGGKKDNRAA